MDKIDKLISELENSCFQEFEIDECLTFRISGEAASLEGDNARKALRTAFEELEQQLAAEREAHRWIPVSERLPEDGQEVMVWSEAIVIPDKVTYIKHKFFYGGWYYETITHWQPLPPAPAPEGGKK